MQPQVEKVFCIGLSKTGTTSLARALEILGYKTRDYIGVTRYTAGDLSCIDPGVIEANDAFTDTPIPSFYRELDARYPGSKFILTTRNMDDWLRSCGKQFTSRIVARQNEATRQLHTDLYGCFEFDAEKYASGYTRFVEGVLDYFSDRPHDLLVTDICGGDTWDRLCAFLDKPVPEIPFPVTNVSTIQWMNIRKIVDLARQAGHETRKLYLKDPRSRCARQGNRLACFLSAVSARLPPLPGRDVKKKREARLSRARDISQKIIVDGLQKMNPAIPVLSPENADLPRSERTNWSHFWIIDPLDGAEGFLDPDGSYTINIALVEGDRPVWGVVHDPLADTVYYAKGASGAYRIRGNSDPEPIAHTDTETGREKLVLLPAGSALPEKTGQDLDKRLGFYRIASAHCATALCQVAEGKAAAYVSPEPTRERETAAGHAIARAAGKNLYSCDTGDELVYNKKELVNDAFIAE